MDTPFPDTCETEPELLAHHLTAADSPAQAVPYWHLAAQQAMNRSSYAEAIGHLRSGLDTAAMLTDELEQAQCELSLRTTLGVALSMVQGYSSPDVMQTYFRARELCELVGETPQLFGVLRGIWAYYFTCGRLGTAEEFGHRLVDLAQRQEDGHQALEAYRLLATTRFFMGKFDEALPHLQQGLELYDAQRRAQNAQYGQDSGVVCQAYIAWILWLQGFSEQALLAIQRSLQLAEQTEHPYVRCYARLRVAVLHQWRREPEAVRHWVEESLALASEHGFTLLESCGRVFHGWVMAEQGQAEAGCQQIREHIDLYRQTGVESVVPYMYGLLAEACAQAGDIEAGIEATQVGLSFAHEHEERWWEAELHRLEGELWWREVEPDRMRAEAALERALETARAQQSLALELRATVSQYRLRQEQGQRAQALSQLSTIYEAFTEGHETVDLQMASALLNA